MSQPDNARLLRRLSDFMHQTLWPRLYLSIGEAAKIPDISIRQISYWTDKGIIKSAAEEGDNRIYNMPNLILAFMIKIGLDDGYSLEKASEHAQWFFNFFQFDPDVEPSEASDDELEEYSNHKLMNLGKEKILAAFYGCVRERLVVSIKIFTSLKICSRRQACYWTDKGHIDCLEEEDGDKKQRIYGFWAIYKAYLMSEGMVKGISLDAANQSVTGEFNEVKKLLEQGVELSSLLQTQGTDLTCQAIMTELPPVGLEQVMDMYLTSVFVLAPNPFGQLYTETQLYAAMKSGIARLIDKGILESTNIHGENPVRLRLSAKYQQQLHRLLVKD